MYGLSYTKVLYRVYTRQPELQHTGTMDRSAQTRRSSRPLLTIGNAHGASIVCLMLEPVLFARL